MRAVRAAAMPRVFLLCLSFAVPAAMAAEAVSYGEGVIPPQRDASVVKALGPDLFGEEINGSTGGLSFSQVDLALPGNGPAVEVRRRLTIDGNKSPSHSADVSLWKGHAFGEWEIDLPYLTGTYTQAEGWVVGGSQPNARCSGPTTFAGYRPGTVNVGYAYFSDYNYWNGLQLNVPGSGEQQVLYRPATSPPLPPAGTWTALTTADQWHFACLPTLDSGQPGEGFLAIAPDGTRYWLDWMVDFEERPLRGSGITYVLDKPFLHRETLERRVYRLYPTRVEDRFGNYVTYTWSGKRLTAIAASDGRSIQFTANAGGQVATATAAGRTVTYGYSAGLLTTVTRADGTQWGYSTAAIIGLARFATLSENLGEFDHPYSCQLMRPLTGAEADLVMTHPSGAQGTYRLSYNRLHRTNLAGSTSYCDAFMQEDGIPITWLSHQPHVPTRFDVLGLQRKTLTGAALSTQVWEFDYEDHFTFAPTYGYPTNGTREVTTTRPDGNQVVETYGTDALVNEGQLLSRVVLEGSTVLTTTENTYVQTSEMGSMPFPDWMGEPLAYEFIRGRSSYNRPLKKSVITQQGSEFRRTIDQFDGLVRPVEVTRESATVGSAPRYSRTELVDYHDNHTKWVLGQEAKRRCTGSIPSSTACLGNNDSVMSETIFDGTYALPLLSYGHGGQLAGRLVTSRTYDTTSTVASRQLGTLKTVSDGRDATGFNTTITLSDWYRGVPRLIQYPATPDQPTGTSQAALVNPDGTIDQVTDENNLITQFGYDTMGRLNLVDYPDNEAWNSTLRTFSFVGAAYGLPSHWRMWERTGNGYTLIHYDALWRPVVEEAYDNADSTNTRSIVVKRYDVAGRLAFQSYPMRTLSDWEDTSLKGTYTFYDAMDRVVRVEQDWEGTGRLTTLTVHTGNASGPYTKITDAKGNITRTWHQAFDQPSYDAPVTIWHPESAYTHITRDPFAKPTRLRRSNSSSATGGTGIDRLYTYDLRQQLCRQVEPETGATLMGYDAAGNLAWSASGLPASTACDVEGDTAAILARRVVRTYDARGRAIGLAFTGGLGDTTTTYTPDGLPASITAYNGTNVVTTTYAYNSRRLLAEERMLWNSFDWPVTYHHDVNGHLAQLDVRGLSLPYAPNALGQPTKVGTYATGVSYFPNGAISQFTYGNGLVHALTQNVRGLPERSRDALSTQEVLDDYYDYDGNGNVLAITDARTGGNQRGNRTMTYDGLDRLRTAVSPMWSNGTASYTYDVLDNLTRVTVPATGMHAARDHHYCYDPVTNLLTNVKNTSCSGATVIGIDYDVQGNVEQKNADTYVFDFGNRLRQSIVDGASTSYVYDGLGRRVRDLAGTSKYSMYSRSGQLLFAQDNRKAEQQWHVFLGGSLVAIRKRDTGTGAVSVHYQHTDALGSPVAVTDAARTELYRSEYEPYGQLANRANDDLPGYTGHVMDARSGLTYMQQRYYDPGIGMFLSVDPVTAHSSPVGQFHRYRYANNSPYKFVDPDGRRGVTGCVGRFCKEYAEQSKECAMTCVQAGQEQRQPRPYDEKLKRVQKDYPQVTTDMADKAFDRFKVDNPRSSMSKGRELGWEMENGGLTPSREGATGQVGWLYADGVTKAFGHTHGAGNLWYQRYFSADDVSAAKTHDVPVFIANAFGDFRVFVEGMPVNGEVPEGRLRGGAAEGVLLCEDCIPTGE